MQHQEELANCNGKTTTITTTTVNESTKEAPVQGKLNRAPPKVISDIAIAETLLKKLQDKDITVKENPSNPNLNLNRGMTDIIQEERQRMEPKSISLSTSFFTKGKRKIDNSSPLFPLFLQHIDISKSSTIF